MTIQSNMEITNPGMATADTATGAANPKRAALLAAASLAPPEPPPFVTYRSQGRLLIVGPAQNALRWASVLGEQLDVTVLISEGALPPAVSIDTPSGASARYRTTSGSAVRISGWLGAFHVTWEANGIEQTPQQMAGEFDLIFDLSSTPLITLHQPPQGYHAAGSEPQAAAAALELAELTGEFEKPKFFRYKDSLCAHSRNRVSGCNACIDICSARAIAADGDKIRVNPHLCAGCGACTTVCPSGALTYAYPSAPDTGMRMKTLLSAFTGAGGSAPVLLLHSDERGAQWLQELEQSDGEGGIAALPANMLPLALHHTASVGIELWLLAIAYGAAGVVVLMTDEEAPDYVIAVRKQMTIAQTIMAGFGYTGRHFNLLHATDCSELRAKLPEISSGQPPAQAARFNAAADKRNTLDMTLAHLYRHAPPEKGDLFALPAGAPLGAVEINAAACTLCMACAGSCPKSALMTAADLPQLRFIERNCVQCGLCAETCPENAISLLPRLSMRESARNAVVLNETQPFHCIRCNKPFGTLKVIESMLARLMTHEAFQDNLDRLKMCGDCRVVDMMKNGRGPSRISEAKR